MEGRGSSGRDFTIRRLEESLRKLRKREIMNDILPFDILADNWRYQLYFDYVQSAQFPGKSIPRRNKVDTHFSFQLDGISRESFFPSSLGRKIILERVYIVNGDKYEN